MTPHLILLMKHLASSIESRGPFCFEAVQVFAPGAEAAELFSGGAEQADTFSPGAEAVQTGC